MLLVVISSIENLCYRDFLIDLYKEYKEDMFRYACSILREERLAEDAVNQAFLGIIKNVEKIYDLDVSKIKSYVVISVRNACYNINQKRSRQWEKEVMCDYIEDITIDDTSSFLDEDSFDYVKQAVGALDEQYKTVILLRYYKELSYNEIAEKMNISPKHVSVLLTRAKSILKKEIITRRDEYEK